MAGLNIIIGNPPPGVNGTRIVRIGPPLFEEVQGDFDVMRETLWVDSLSNPAIVPGINRTIQGGLGGSSIWIINTKRQTGIKAGRPVIELISKGWMATKPNIYTLRRNAGGDAGNGVVEGFAYVTRTMFSLTRGTGAGSSKVAPPFTWGYGDNVWNPTYGTSWPYYPTGNAFGWLWASREINELPGESEICRTVDTWAYDRGAG